MRRELDYKWVALTVTTIGIFMVGLDARIVIIGLPQVAAQLHADAERAIWITQSYVLASTVLLLLVGRLSDVFGRVRLYSVGFAIFTIGSLLTSLGFNSGSVIAFRTIQGFGAALIFVNSVAIITDASPKRELGFFIGMNQVAYRAGAILGLTISGLILSVLSWRALFYVSVPVGIVGTVLAQRRLRDTGERDPETSIDWTGFAIFAVFIVALMTALTIGAYISVHATVVHVLFIVSAISFPAFLLWERRMKCPLVDFHMFKIDQVREGIIAVLFNVIAWAAMLLLLSLQFQLVLGESPLGAGLKILPFEIAFLAVGPLSSAMSDRFGHLRFTLSGIVLGTIALFLFSTTNPSTPYSVLTIYMIIMGTGTGLFLAPNFRSVMSALPGDRRGIGSAVVTLFLNVGLSVSLNLAILIMSLTAPYSLITRLISSATSAGMPADQMSVFMQSIKNTYLAMAVVNAVAIIPLAFQLARRLRAGASVSAPVYPPGEEPPIEPLV